MAKNTFQLNEMKKKSHRKFQVVIASNTDWKEITVYGDEISNINGILEVFEDSDLVAVIKDYIFITETTSKKNPE